MSDQLIFQILDYVNIDGHNKYYMHNICLSATYIMTDEYLLTNQNIPLKLNDE